MNLKHWTIFLSLIAPIRTDIEIRNQMQLITITSAEASFGHSLPLVGLAGRAIRGEPLHGCTPITKAPHRSVFDPHWFVLLTRTSNCTFETKVASATSGNYSGAVIFNDRGDEILHMGGEGIGYIPSVFIGETDGLRILRNYTFNNHPNVTMVLLPDEPFDLNVYLLPFAIVIGICFLLMLGIVIFKCVQDHRRNRRHRLPKSALKNLPIIKYKEESSPYDTCCICLDDYVNNDKLRVLPCDHAYHKTCIDPWLVKNKRICPQCRKKVFGESLEESEDEDTHSEVDSLLSNVRSINNTRGGTFAGSGTYAAAVADQISNSRPRFNFFGRRRRDYRHLESVEDEPQLWGAGETTQEDDSEDLMHVAIVHSTETNSYHSMSESEEDAVA